MFGIETFGAGELAGEPPKQLRRVVSDDDIVDIHPNDHYMRVDMLYEQTWIVIKLIKSHYFS